MSNPCINRWGLNTFWHNFWFTDHNYSVNVRQDKAFAILIQTFIFHGVNINYNIFCRPYWYSNNFSHLSIKTYQRFFYYYPVGIKAFAERYSIRQEADCIFPMKIWILRYSHWVIINQYWFNPFKGRRRKLKLFEIPSSFDAFSSTKSTFKRSIRRLQTLSSITPDLKPTYKRNYLFY